MVAAAYTLTRGSLADPAANLVLWGSAAAAVVAALVVLSNGPAVIGWAAIGYVVFAALLATSRPVPLLLLLGVAYMPVLQRPRGSLVAGLAIAFLTAAVLAVLVGGGPTLR
jgi:hypothetical protein